jgi:peptide deformylase
MAVRQIITYPAPILRKEAKSVQNITDDIVRLSEDMVETMHLARGAGLAAVQVGSPVRLIVLDPETEKRGQNPLIILNPVIVEQESEETAEEGCLSLPKFYEFVKRAAKVCVRGVWLTGESFEMDCQGHMARAFQHEIDHLNGILFIDHLSPIKKGLFKKKYPIQAS